MPSKKAARDWLDFEVKQGRGEESCHVIDVTAEQQKRIANDKRKMKFVLNCDDPDLCSAFEKEKDRIIKRVGNKSMALSLMAGMWLKLTDADIDSICAREEMESADPKPPGPERATIPDAKDWF